MFVKDDRHGLSRKLKRPLKVRDCEIMSKFVKLCQRKKNWKRQQILFVIRILIIFLRGQHICLNFSAVNFA